MSSTEERIAGLAKKLLNLDHDPDFDVHFSERQVSSLDTIAFARAIGQEFNHDIPAEKFASFNNLRELATYLDANA